jgi:prepilin-type processing-associated H-X9-DG protein
VAGLVPGKQLSQFDAPADWLLLCEEAATAGAQDAVDGSTNDGYFFQPQQDNFSRRHTNGSNFLFADYHVKWLSPDIVRAKGYAIGGTGPAPWGRACP